MILTGGFNDGGLRHGRAGDPADRKGGMMQLKRPLAMLDLETTGTWIERDRIIEIGIVRCEPDGTRREYDQRINPGMPISSEVTALTGISNDDVKDAPRFKEVAPVVLEMLKDADIGGFNVERFDVPLLAREFADNGFSFAWQGRTIYDAQKVYHLNEKRDLTAAYAFYCHKELDGAHSALADTRATLEVLEAQVVKYGKGSESLESLGSFDYKILGDFFGLERKFRWWNGELYMMFGKYAGKMPLKEVAKNDPRYLEWILSANFSDEVKELVGGALEGHFPSRPEPKAGQ